MFGNESPTPAQASKPILRSWGALHHMQLPAFVPLDTDAPGCISHILTYRTSLPLLNAGFTTPQSQLSARHLGQLTAAFILVSVSSCSSCGIEFSPV
jgi:hypothetical protein